MTENRKEIQPQATGTQPASPLSSKRPYHAPTLREHGNISQHTLAVIATLSGSDGGVGIPFVYSS